MERLNHGRLENSLKELGKVGATPGGGRTRLALTDEDKAGRDLLCRWIREAGLELKVDAIGNIYGILPGPGGAVDSPVMSGSHIDTVRDAGMFDGCLGVLSALECLRTVREKGLPHKKPLAMAAFTNEEGARFQPDMMGSLVAGGLEKLEDIYASVDEKGCTVGEELERIGYRGTDTIRPSAFIEYHIEQGPLLHAQGIQIGSVTGIYGINWWRGRFAGQPNHAGTTPMDMRRDALYGLSQVHVRGTELARRTGARFTIGRVNVAPGIPNVVPGTVDFTLDLRHADGPTLEHLNKAVVGIVNEVAAENGLELELEQNVNARPVAFDASLIAMVERHAAARGLSLMRLGSPAGQDAQMMANVAPTTMIFVPSIGGLSHCPEEQTGWPDVAAGAEVLLDCLLELAG